MTAWLIAAHRTACVPRNGAFYRLLPWQLATPLVTTLLTETALPAAAVDEVVLGNALGGGGNPARVLALASGLQRVAGMTVDRQCCSGLDAILLAARLVESKGAEVVIAGGAESFSRRPLRWRTDPYGGPPQAYSRPPFTPWPERDPAPHQQAASLAQRLGLSAEQQAKWTIDSHAKALQAVHSGRFGPELQILSSAPLCCDAVARAVNHRLCRRSPVVAGDGEMAIRSATVAVEADAAALVLVVSERIKRQLRQMPSILVTAGITLGADAEEPALAAVAASQKCLAQAGLQSADCRVVELMEAYAVQAMAAVLALELEPVRVNRGGGALARGHPIAASGAILAVRLFHELRRTREEAYGLATIAAMGGLGSALLLQHLP